MCVLSVMAHCTCELLLQFHPPGGPIEGGTKLTVTGVNLGKVAADLQVTVDGIECTVEDDNYIPSQRCVRSLSWNLFYFYYCLL